MSMKISGEPYRIAADGSVTRHFDPKTANFRELRYARAFLGDVAKDLRNKMSINQTPLTASERTTLSHLMRESEALEMPLAAAEDRNEADRAAAGGGGAMDGDATASDRARALAGIPAAARDTPGDHVARGGPVRGVKTFAQLFPAVSMSAGGFADNDDFVAAVASGRFHPSLTPMAADPMHTGNDPHGGFAVPTQFASRYLNRILEASIVLPRSTAWPMASKTLEIPMFAANGGDSGPYGVAASWIDESGVNDMNPKEFSLELMTLTARSLALYVEAANSLVADGLSFGTQLEMAMNGSAAWTLDECFLVSGTGAGQPLSILNSAARVTVTKETGQPGGTLTYQNAVDMLARLAPGSFDRSVWVASQTALPQLLTMSVPVGTGGAFVPAVPSEGGRLTLLTRPLLISEKLPALGTEGDLMLCDFSAYQIGMRAEWSLDTSTHIGFRRNKTAFRLIIRIDGQPGLRTPYTPANGSTLSPFVTLESRT